MAELYSLPDGWEWKKLGELCDFIRGPFGGSLKNKFSKKMVMQFMSKATLYTINLNKSDILLMMKNLKK